MVRTSSFPFGTKANVFPLRALISIKMIGCTMEKKLGFSAKVFLDGKKKIINLLVFSSCSFNCSKILCC